MISIPEFRKGQLGGGPNGSAFMIKLLPLPSEDPGRVVETPTTGNRHLILRVMGCLVRDDEWWYCAECGLMDSSKRSDYNMTVWVSLLLIAFAGLAFAGLGILHLKARAAKVRRTEKAFEQQRNLATERLERAIAESTAKTPESSIHVLEKVKAAQVASSIEEETLATKRV